MALRDTICNIFLKELNNRACIMRNKNKLYNNFTRHIIIYILISIIAVLLLAGCGKKAPPVPPRQVKLSAINELDAPTVENVLNLTRDIHNKKRTFAVT